MRLIEDIPWIAKFVSVTKIFYIIRTVKISSQRSIRIGHNRLGTTEQTKTTFWKFQNYKTLMNPNYLARF